MMIGKLHHAWLVLAAVWLTIAPAPAHATQTFRQQATNTPRATAQDKTAAVARASAAGCANPYTVRKGDTLAKISRACGVSVADLKNLNGLSGTTIRVGQVLVIRAPRAMKPITTPAPTPTIESGISPW